MRVNQGPRIIGGAWRGKHLAAPPGLATRPTGARARQAVFDILLHAPWGGLELLQQARVLDVFAGTGAFGLEALSRGAAAASFIENAPPALTALRANIAACRVGALARVVAADALSPPAGTPHEILLLDPLMRKPGAASARGAGAAGLDRAGRADRGGAGAGRSVCAAGFAG